ncbi:MAG: hypothetical protein ACXVB1_17880 [Pseudobdellovibrionaceae bacterium]
MKRTYSLEKMLLALTFISCASLQALADSNDTVVKIADCVAAADGNNSAETIALSYKGGDRNSADQYVVHFKSENVDKDFPVQNIEWMDNGASVQFQFAKFLIAKIYNGQSTNSTIGVALGNGPRNMTCNAKF